MGVAEIVFWFSILALFCVIDGFKLGSSLASTLRPLTVREIFMNKDKKKKKKKTADGASTPTSSIVTHNPSPKPMRVTTNTNIPVRQQIAWVRAYKRLVSQSSKQQAKKFRQENIKEEAEEYVEVDYVNCRPPAVFVDGYNIIFHINREEGRNLNLEEARDCLISDLCVLRGATGWWIEVVFDAYKALGPQSSQSVDDVIVTYTSKVETADNYIERRFEELRKDNFKNIVVATDDLLLRTTAGSSGAGFLSAGMLVEEFRIAYKGWEHYEEETIAAAKRNKPRLGDMVSGDIRDAIAKLKQLKATGNQPAL